MPASVGVDMKRDEELVRRFGSESPLHKKRGEIEGRSDIRGQVPKTRMRLVKFQEI